MRFGFARALTWVLLPLIAALAALALTAGTRFQGTAQDLLVARVGTRLVEAKQAAEVGLGVGLGPAALQGLEESLRRHVQEDPDLTAMGMLAADGTLLVTTAQAAITSAVPPGGDGISDGPSAIPGFRLASLPVQDAHGRRAGTVVALYATESPVSRTAALWSELGGLAGIVGGLGLVGAILSTRIGWRRPAVAVAAAIAFDLTLVVIFAGGALAALGRASAPLVESQIQTVANLSADLVGRALGAGVPMDRLVGVGSLLQGARAKIPGVRALRIEDPLGGTRYTLGSDAGARWQIAAPIATADGLVGHVVLAVDDSIEAPLFKGAVLDLMAGVLTVLACAMGLATTFAVRRPRGLVRRARLGALVLVAALPALTAAPSPIGALAAVRGGRILGAPGFGPALPLAETPRVVEAVR